MQKLLLLASLCSSLTAYADALPAPKACADGGLQIAADHQGRGLDVGSSGIKIWEKGAIEVYSYDPKALRNIDVMACLTDQERKDLRAALAKTTWKVTTNMTTCTAVSPAHTVWSAGKRSFDDVSCGHETIDAETKNAFAFVTALETTYMKRAPAAPSPTKAP